MSINGTQVLTDFDIAAAAGGKDKAVAEAFTATADGNGQITVSFSQGAADYPLVNGIEVLSGSTVVQAINCGELAGGTLTVNPSTFTNQGSLQATNGETLNINGLTGNLGAARLGNSSSLSIGGNYVVDQGLTIGAGQSATLNGNWRNASTIAVSGAGILALNGTWTNASVPLSGVNVNVYSGFQDAGGGVLIPTW